ncbi:MAG: NAD(P)/FAD-dependent oxidoreductase [Nitrososphaeria archaeon]
MTDEKYDVIVVGAGTGGALTAFSLAEKGVKVLLVDCKVEKLIGKKVCGDALGLHHIKNVKLPYPPKDTFKGRIDFVKVYSPSSKYAVTVEGEGLALDRHRFGQWLLGLALDKGAELMADTRATTLSYERGRATQLRMVCKGQSTQYIKAEYFVDASGYDAVLRRQIPDTPGIQRDVSLEDVSVAYREIRRVEQVEDIGIAKIFLDQELAPGGYWWYFPQDEHTLNIGVGVQGGRNINPKDKLKEVIRRREDLQKSSILEAGGGIVPTRRSLYSLVAKNVLFIGDAACTANPIHGGGIGPSMLSARTCGGAIVKALNDRENEEEKLWEANTEYTRLYGAKSASLDIFRMFLQALTNEEIEFGMMKQLISDKDLAEIGYGTGSLTLKDKVLKLLKGFTKPGVLINLSETAKYMRTVKEEYDNYPHAKEFPEWVSKVEGIFKEYSRNYAFKK